MDDFQRKQHSHAVTQLQREQERQPNIIEPPYIFIKNTASIPLLSKRKYPSITVNPVFMSIYSPPRLSRERTQQTQRRIVG